MDSTGAQLLAFAVELSIIFIAFLGSSTMITASRDQATPRGEAQLLGESLGIAALQRPIKQE